MLETFQGNKYSEVSPLKLQSFHVKEAKNNGRIFWPSSCY
ncbi:unnamed protein product, partial [Callosobruchus maculatus]